MTTVHRYGVHWEGEFAFLHEQEGKSVCLTEGFGDLPSPFVVARRDREVCPHALLGGPEEPILPIPQHPLVDAMAPVPGRTQAVWIPSEWRGLIEEMTALSSLKPPTLFTPWANRLIGLVPRLTVSNLTPLIVVGYEMRHLPDIVRFIDLPRTRPLVFCGSFQPPRTTEILTDGLETLRSRPFPWRAIGLSILRASLVEPCSDLTRSLTSAS